MKPFHVIVTLIEHHGLDVAKPMFPPCFFHINNSIYYLNFLFSILPLCVIPWFLLDDNYNGYGVHPMKPFYVIVTLIEYHGLEVTLLNEA